MWADGKKLCRYSHFRHFGRDKCAVRVNHISLRRDHAFGDFLVIERLRTARLTALEQAVIALRVKQPLLIKACFLKAVIHVGRDHEIVLVSHQLQKVVIDRLRCIHIAVDVDVPAPIRPEFFLCGERIEAAAVHIPHAVLCRKIGKVFFKPFAGVGEARRRRQTGAGTNHYGITVL